MTDEDEHHPADAKMPTRGFAMRLATPMVYPNDTDTPKN